MMTVAAQGDALIIDLRKNGGGMDTVDTIISQLVPQGSPLSGSFDRPSGKSTTHVSPAPSGARRFGDTKRSEEHTSELQSLMRISYAVFCLKKKKTLTREYKH